MSKLAHLRASALVLTSIALMPAFALQLGSNVTIFDKNGSGTGWHGAQEDNEVETGMETGQKWDLEGTFVNNNFLTLVGGYNFLDGEKGGGSQIFYSGDVFLALGKEPDFERSNRGGDDGNLETEKTYGYDYALSFDGTGTYSLFQLTENTILSQAYYKQNEGSSPFKIVSGATEIGKGNVSFHSAQNMSRYQQSDALMDDDTGFKGDYEGHNSRFAMSFDLTVLYSQLASDEKFYSHFTMGCGNDNLMGSWDFTPVSEPATLGLLGLGIAGMFAARRRRAK